MKITLIPLITAISLLSQANAVNIAISTGEFTDYSSLSHGAVFGASSVTASGFTLSMLNDGGREINESAYDSGVDDLGADYGVAFTGTSNATSQKPADLADALAGDTFLTLGLSSTGASFDWESISVTLFRNAGASATNYAFLYDDEGTGYDTGDELTSIGPVGTTGYDNPFDLSYSTTTIASGVTNAEVRLYYWGNTHGLSPAHLIDVTATYSVIPEPATFAFLVGICGLGLCFRRRRSILS